MDWMAYKDAFEWDGSLRDMYVFETNEHDWQRLLTFLRSGLFELDYFVDDNPAQYLNMSTRYLHYPMNSL